MPTHSLCRLLEVTIQSWSKRATFIRYWVHTWPPLGPKPLRPLSLLLRVFFFALILHWWAQLIIFFVVFWPYTVLLFDPNGYHKNLLPTLYTAQNQSKSDPNHDWYPKYFWGNKSHEWFCSWDLHHHKLVWNIIIPSHETSVSYRSRIGWVPLPKHFDVIWYL